MLYQNNKKIKLEKNIKKITIARMLIPVSLSPYIFGIFF